MTDLERFVELYKSFGIECIVNDINNQKIIYLNDASKAKEEQTTFSEKFDGYSGFYSEVIFDSNGVFIQQNFWE